MASSGREHGTLTGARQAVGLVAPLPPQSGGVPLFAQWLLDRSDSIGCDYRCFDLRRPPGSGGGGRVAASSIPIQARNLARFLPWVVRAPRLVHYCVASNPTGLARDLVFLALLRLARRRTIAHVHGGTELEHADSIRFYRTALRALSRLSVGVVAVGPSAAERLREAGVPATPLLNPVRVDATAIRPVREDRQRPLTVLFVGSLCREKGCFELLDAFAAVRRTAPGTTLVLAGPEKYSGEAERLRAACRRLGLGEAVEFVGALGPRELARAYGSADVFCLPSRREGLPMALLEAMASGLPVVVTRTGAVQDVVTDGVTGLLLEPGDGNGLTLALARLVSDRELRAKLAAAGRAAVGSSASAEAIVSGWRSIYRAALQRS